MTRRRKIVFSLLASLLLVLIAAYCVAERVITANLSKAFIIEKLETATGYDVDIAGPLHWHYSLHPQLSLDKITFKSNANEVVMLEKTEISLNLLPLLHKKLSVDFSFEHLKQSELNFTKGKGHVGFENKLLSLSEFTAQFYRGEIKGNAQVEFSNDAPKISTSIKASQIEIADLLNDIAHSASISGKMDINADLTSQGENSAEFMSHLNGKISMLTKNGKLNTIHLGGSIPGFLSSKKEADFFDTLDINAPIINGIANTKIQLLARNYRAEGEGKINLMNQSLNLRLYTYYTRSESTKNITIPVDISGPIASPKISADITQPLNQLLSANQGKLSKRLQQFLNR